jgi:transcription antitermination factor NusG
MENSMKGWYVIYTRPKSERKVKLHLEKAAITTFLPTMKTIRQWHDRKKAVDALLFPSYIFVYLQNTQQYFDSLNADGFLYYVKTEKKMARVSDEIIYNIRLLVNGNTEIEVTDRYFRPGQKLVIGEGPLTSLSCEMVQYNGNNRILVRLNLLNRNIMVTCSSEALISTIA